MNANRSQIQDILKTKLKADLAADRWGPSPDGGKYPTKCIAWEKNEDFFKLFDGLVSEEEEKSIFSICVGGMLREALNGKPHAMRPWVVQEQFHKHGEHIVIYKPSS